MTNQENKATQKSGIKSDSNQKNNATTDSGNSGSTVENVKNTAQDVLDKAKDSAGQIYGIAAEKAASTVTEQKNQLSGGLSSVAGSIRQIGQDLRQTEEKNPFVDLTAKYGDAAADQIERLSGYFDEKDLREIYRDVETFARRQPAVFIGAALVVGFLAVRFLRSGSGSSARSQFAARGGSNINGGNASATPVNPS